jgi:GT2 family glycosyltransferase
MLNEPLPPPICSICIANYNGENMLVDCLESVLAQSVDVPIEVIVHDDASSDGSLEVLKRYPRVVVIASAENVGFCIANNRMVARASGEFVLLLNNDASLYPDALATLLEAARQQTPRGILTLPQYDWHTGELVDRGCLLDPFYNLVPNLDPVRRDVAIAIGACLFISRALWDTLGGFPEWFESIGEDLYLCCLARLHGTPVQTANSSGFRHRQGASFSGNRLGLTGLQSTFRRRRLSERNKTAVMVICTPTILVWPLLVLHVIIFTFEGIAMTCLKGDSRIWLEIYGPAIRFAFGCVIELRARRKQVQLQRQTTLRAYLRAFVMLPQKLRLLLRHGIPTIR